ncbi:MAG TPA: acyl-CoA dehydrogenase family protein [Bacillota bacterium]
MDLELSETQRALRDLVRDYVTQRVIPEAARWEEERWIPDAVFRELGELGLLGLPFPEEYGGSGLDTISLALAIEELARGDASLALSVAAHISLGCTPIFRFGDEEQKRTYLVPAAQGEILAAFGLTEAEAGSDAGATRTTAVATGDGWLITGRKVFITNGSRAGVVTITAVTDPDRGKDGISNFIVPRGTPGFTAKRPYQKLGLHASDTAELIFDDCRLPAASLLGQRGRGFRNFLEVLDGGRIGIGALSVGIAQACLDAALRYAKQRHQFGRPIGKFQAIQFKLADMATQIDAARLLVYRAAWLKDRGRDYRTAAAKAKLFASEIAERAALEAVQIHGGWGYMREFNVERYLRDVKLMTIGEGTSEIQRLVIARGLGL